MAGRFHRTDPRSALRAHCHAAIVTALRLAVDTLTRIGDHEEAARYRLHLDAWEHPAEPPPAPGAPHLRLV